MLYIINNQETESKIDSCSVMSDSWQPMNCSLPGSSVHGILQARILEWVAIPFSRGSSPPKDQTQVSFTAGRFFTIWATRKALNKRPEINKFQIELSGLTPKITPWNQVTKRAALAVYPCWSQQGQGAPEVTTAESRHACHHGLAPLVDPLPAALPSPILKPGAHQLETATEKNQHL